MVSLPPELSLHEGVFTAASLFDAVHAEAPWADHVFRIFGRTVPMPRRIAWMGPVPYAYSGVVHAAAEMTPTVRDVCDVVQELLGEPYNCALLNLYRDGRDSMGWHHDADYDHGGQPAIASVSLGAPRRFALRARNDQTRVSFVLPPGSLLRMGPGTQERWLHAIPKTTEAVGPRINITLRHVAER